MVGGMETYSKAVCPGKRPLRQNITGNLRHFQGAEVEDRELMYIWCFLFSLLLNLNAGRNPRRARVMSLASKAGGGHFSFYHQLALWWIAVWAQGRAISSKFRLGYCNVWHGLSESVKTVTHMKSLYYCMALSNSVKGPLVTYWWSKCVCAY